MFKGPQSNTGHKMGSTVVNNLAKRVLYQVLTKINKKAL